MKNILTIYKFNFPFFEHSFEYIKSREIIADLKRLFQYNEINISDSKKISGDYILTNIRFKGGEVNIVFHDNSNNYFIPKFQFDLQVDNNFTEKIYREIIKIFETIGLQEYICLFQNKPDFVKDFDINTLYNLEENFKNYSYENLKQFIKATDKDYLDFKLRENRVIRNSFYYMIFICFIFYKNIKASKNNIIEMNKLLEKDIFDIYKGNLNLGKTRLIEYENMSISHFKKYKLMLDKLFELISK